MNAVIVYDSRFGNTRQIAEQIEEGLRQAFTVQLLTAEQALPLPAAIDLLLVGGPTHAHGMSAAMKAVFAHLQRGALRGVPAAAFDTRFQMPRWLTGSAAASIGARLERAGCRLLLPPESFFVDRGADGGLLPGEQERARAWAAEVQAALGAEAGRAEPGRAAAGIR